MSREADRSAVDDEGCRGFSVVSGLPRSGTSLMMQMLAAGGLPPLTDGVRRADEDNPRGYYEWEPSKRLSAQPDAILAARGRAVKVISALLETLPRAYRYRVIFMERDAREVEASQRAMLARRADARRCAVQENLEGPLERHTGAIKSWLASQPHLETCFVDYREAVEDAAAVASRVNAFLGGSLDESAMAAAVVPALHHCRAKRRDESLP